MRLDLIQKFARRSGDRPGRSRRRFAAAAALLTAGVLGATLVVVSPTQALDRAGVGPRNPKHFGFPNYYTDDAGRALQLCVDGTALCARAKVATLKPVAGEAFYYSATATLRAPGINLDVEFALEAAWAGRTRQIVFDRLRVRGHAAAAGTYNLSTPYGPVSVRAADPVEARNVNFTRDVGCACSFRHAVTSRNAFITEFMVAGNASGRYLGNPNIRSTATLGGAPASLSVTGPAGSATTDRFAVMGKKANP